MNAIYRMKAIMVKEFRQLSRDRITFGMVVMIPLIQLLLFGYAINTDIRDIPVAVVDQSESTAGRILTESVKVTQVVSVTQRYTTAEEAEQAIQDGIVRAALILPNDLTQRMAQGRPLGQWIVDGSDTMISAAILGLQTMPLTDFDFQIRPKPTQTFEVALYYNPSRRSAVNIVPGLLGVILTMTMILFTSAAIVRERERGNLELLITTPVRSFELMVAKIVPYIFCRFDSGVHHLRAWTRYFWRPYQWFRCANIVGYLVVYCRQPHLGIGDFHHRQDTVASHANDGFHLAAFHPTFGFYVPLRGDARGGPMDCRSAPRHPLHAHDSRHCLARRRFIRPVARYFMDDWLYPAWADHSLNSLQEIVGLIRDMVFNCHEGHSLPSF